MTTAKIRELTAEALRALKNVVEWSFIGTVGETDARAFEGNADGWRFIIVDFSVESQGFPKDPRGYDGIASNMNYFAVIHLPRDAAEKAFKTALA